MAHQLLKLLQPEYCGAIKAVEFISQVLTTGDFWRPKITIQFDSKWKNTIHTALDMTMKKKDHWSAFTIIMHHDHVSIQWRHFVERFVAASIVAVIDQLTVDAEWLPVFLTLMPNKVILAEECLVAVFILTRKVLAVAVACPPAPSH